MLQPKYTMYGFEWKDQRGIEGTGFVRALRSLLNAHLPSLLPSLRSNIAEGVEAEIQLHGTAQGTSPDTSAPQSAYQYCRPGSSQVRIFPMVKRVITRANCLIFFGADLCKFVSFSPAAT